MLVQLWQVQDSPAHKEFVILVLETLSDDVFTGEDSAVAMREGVLSKACVEIFTPATVLAEAFPNRQPGPNVRQGNDGWLSRISEFLGHCLDADAKDNSDVTACTIKCFSLLLSLLPWAIPKAVAAARCVDVLTTGLASLDVDVQRVALEGLHALYSRTNLTDTEFLLLRILIRTSIKSLRNCLRCCRVSVTTLNENSKIYPLTLLGPIFYAY
ncbi:hypothetical protein CDD83_2666 [Cordyceps sp. RAO-2017]|nr:hypothetical protein CDD83_2666 [Cordyceps sp. RAO-2017]